MSIGIALRGPLVVASAVALSAWACMPVPHLTRLDVVCSDAKGPEPSLPSECAISTEPGAWVEVSGAVSTGAGVPRADDSGRIALRTDWGLAGDSSSGDGLVPDVRFFSRRITDRTGPSLRYHVDLDQHVPGTTTPRLTAEQGCSATIDGKPVSLDEHGTVDLPSWTPNWDVRTAALPEHRFKIDDLSQIGNRTRPARVLFLDLSHCPQGQTLRHAPIVIRPEAGPVVGGDDLAHADGKGLPWAHSLNHGRGRGALVMRLAVADVLGVGRYHAVEAEPINVRRIGDVELLVYVSEISKRSGSCGAYNGLGGGYDSVPHNLNGFHVIVQDARTRHQLATRDFVGKSLPCPEMITGYMARTGVAGTIPKDSVIFEWLAAQSF